MKNITDINTGLNNEEVKLRMTKKLNNIDVSVKTKTIPEIIKKNLFTLFNLINLSLGTLLLIIGEYKNMLFLGIITCNIIVNIYQEIKTKLTLDKLSFLATNKACVLRNKKEELIDIEKIVIDDILILKSGNQVVVDCIIKEGNVLVDESYLTGEADLISYKKGDSLKSGSFITNGVCKTLVTKVGEECYINSISKDAKYTKPLNSVLLITIKKIIKVITCFIVPVGILLFLTQFRVTDSINEAILGTVAAILGMIPEGLVLLTSTVLILSVLKLSIKNVLVQDLYCIEMLARVDVICFDKTGTLTDGKMKLKEIIVVDDKLNIDELIGNYINILGVENNTIESISKKYKKYNNFNLISKKNFDSSLKYGEVKFKEGCIKLGAPEVLNGKMDITKLQNENRVLLLTFNDKEVAYFIINDNVKKSAKEMIEYFKKQEVSVLIISGDNVNTVTNVAIQSGLDVKAIDLSDKKVTKKLVLEHNVFGRVTPKQKKEIVEILQKNKHFVAMTGDGVNDVLALKQSDCAITIKNGTDMAKNISQIILLDSEYESVPSIINEGRKTVNNIERSATLFLSKNISMIILAIIFILFNLTFPFDPIHLSLTNFFIIGVPSFILALEANYKPICNNLFINILNKSVPTAIIFIFNIIYASILGGISNLTSMEISTISVYLFAYSGFLLVFKLCIPFNKKRILLLSSLIMLFILTTIILRDFYSITTLSIHMISIILLGIIISTLVYTILLNVFEHIFKNKQ